jgi:hypothetical protein
MELKAAASVGWSLRENFLFPFLSQGSDAATFSNKCNSSNVDAYLLSDV